MAIERVYVIGASASGKSTLAAEIGRVTGLPVHNLDEIVRAQVGIGPLRTREERDAMVADIIDSRRWVVEGIHLEWTEPMLAAAEVIIWLDHVRWGRASGRMLKRFYSQALAEARQQRGWRKFFRFRDYGRRLAALARAIPESRRYHQSASGASLSATAHALEPHFAKVIHCTRAADIRLAIERVSGLDRP